MQRETANNRAMQREIEKDIDRQRQRHMRDREKYFFFIFFINETFETERDSHRKKYRERQKVTGQCREKKRQTLTNREKDT